MNQHLQTILNLIQQSAHLSDDEKNALSKAAKDAGKELDIVNFKLDRTEKVKKTTAILLEETIEELEQKRKAVEAQNHELEIESALERVRTIAMSMKSADDMLYVCKAIAQQLELLDVKEIRNVQTAIFYSEKGMYMNYEYYAKHDKTFITETSYTNSEMHRAFAAQMMKGVGESFATHMNGDEVKDWIAYQKTTNVFIDDFLYNASSLNYYWFSLGPVALGISTYQPLKEEDKILFKRFVKVFELAYRRYLDIERAFAQAKEARLETALERVRAVAMAMKNSDELLNVCEVMFKELAALGISNIRNAQVAIENNERQSYFFYVYSDFEKITAGEAAYNSSPIIQRLYKELGKSKDAFYKREYSETEMREWRSWRKSLSPLNDPREETANSMCFYMYSIGKGHIGISTFNAITNEQVEIVKHFRNVFELSYTRFDDLQKAEAQAREAQIQLALERARAQSMMMQHSTELDDTLRVFHEQVLQLTIPSAFSFLWLPDEEKDRHIFWAAWAENNSFKSKAINYPLDRNEPATKQCLIDWKGNESVVSYHVPPTGVESYFAAWNELIAGVDELRPQYFIDGLYYVEAFMRYGCFGVMVKSELQEDEKKILYRFAVEFEQTYTRFLDLQKAEAQAREAQIEAALEKVRSRTLAMQRSDELFIIIKVIYEQLTNLNFNMSQVGFGLNYNASNDLNLWIADAFQEFPVKLNIPYTSLPLFDCFVGAKENGLDFYTMLLTFKEKNEWYHHVFKYVNASDETRAAVYACPGMAGSTALLKDVALYIFNYAGVPYSNAENAVLMRFGKVFEQSYTRFIDLQKGEVQAREAQIEVALERVRSRTLAMQKSEELAETSAVLFKQLISLGIEPHRLYICIMKDDKGESEFWITDEDGSKISSAYTDNLNANESFKKMYVGWKEGKQSLVIDMHDQELRNYFQHLTSLGVPFRDGLKQKRRIQHLAYFNRGFIGMAAPDDQPEETIRLLERFAAVFNLTFTRFNDLQIAEAHALQAEHDLMEIKAAREKAEQTLSELQLTQRQLIQSEKMASLGELTAGIAHEIQNPLNFVNNFSEVNNELIEELKAERSTLKPEEQDELLNNIFQNNEKIAMHGKRADAIVKGMLQHSRKSSGIKEPTDINALCDEYLRLSYHGLRAKDKNFNADFKTDFDETIGKINIVPQDIGRVLLNLYNNAFYAVSKNPQLLKGSEYKPLVTVTTKKIISNLSGAKSSPSGAKGLLIIVTDNGNGIPQNIIDKIFQPFFTTKPTGQGTGLGLSLAYDIITKEHGGTIKAESKEGKGSAFIIQLPVNKA